MDYETVIGLEVHSQLLTNSKMFCSCEASYQDASPNTKVCPICLGLPGTLPVINVQAVEYVVRTGLALDCSIANLTKFDRKNYPYPDLMKGYQISQYDLPIASNGVLAIESDGEEKVVGVTRVHLEEDVAKLQHRQEEYGEGYSLLDVNRSGTPLMEIVSEPDMRSPDEAYSYLTRLRSILRYIGVSTANMEEGSFRCDANISVRPVGSSELGSKVEVKNMNSFRSVYRALEFEIERQINASEAGEHITQETRGWVEERNETVSQRTKEYASDYRYFPEPDLPPIVIDPDWVREVAQSLPELPEARKARFMQQYGLPLYDGSLLTASRSTAEYFEEALKATDLEGEAQGRLARSVSNWISGEIARLLNQTGTEISDMKVAPGQLIELVDMVDAGTLSNNMAKTVFEEMFASGRSAKAIAEESGMAQVSDVDTIMAAVEEAVSANPSAVEDYLGGKESAIRFLVGQVMRLTKGQANPQIASELLNETLESMR